MVEAALTYAQAGLRVHPCRPADKRPLTRWGTAATTDPDAIAAFWKRWPDALIAVCTGSGSPGSGLVVVDIDPRNGGEYDPELARTLTATTRSGGWHHWFYSPLALGNRVNVTPGVDVRADGGYVIAPPSPGWAWVDPDQAILPLAGAFVAWQEDAGVSGRFRPGFEPAERVAEGGRNDYIARFAGWAIRQGWVDEVVELSLEHNAQVCVPPLDEAEVRRTARSILARHRRAA